MNKFYTLLLLSGAALSANAQQINGSFDGEWSDCIPWDSKGNTKSSGTQPEGWTISNVYVGSKVVVGEAEAHNDGKAVKLTNTEAAGQKVPAYLTLGTSWATAETWFTAVRNADGGTWGGKEFTFHPDALSFDYKRDNSHGKEKEDASVIAYLWNGTWTQKDVPANTAIGIVGYGTAQKVDMVDRDRNVLGMEKTNAVLGGDVTSTEGATCVAKINYAITGNTKKPLAEGEKDKNEYEWVSDTIDFDYGDNVDAKVEKINVIFSATNYFGDRKHIVKNNSLSIDNVKLIYWHGLKSLKAFDNEGNDAALEFDPNVYTYNVNSTFNDSYTPKHTKKGAGAKVEAKYDAKTAKYVITVKAEDYDAETNPEAISTYTIQYVKPSPTLTSLSIDGHEFGGVYGLANEINVTGKYNDNAEVTYKASSEYATVEKSFEGKTLTITVSEEGTTPTVYTVTFEGKENDAVYQIPNSNFEAWTAEGKLNEGWHSFESATGALSSFASLSPAPTMIEDGFEGKAVRLRSANLMDIAKANGNLTTGTISMGNYLPTDPANYNYTDRTNVNGNLPFAGTPDAFEVYARFTPGTARDLTDEEKANGTEIKLQGRMQLILHDNAPYHDPELEAQVGSKIASASVLIPETTKWTKFTGEFNYVGEPSDKQYMLASATTNPMPGASQDDQLDLDNVKLIYWHALSELTFDGKAVEGFDAEKTEYTVKGNLADDNSKIAYKVKGKGAKASTSLDLENNVLKITVEGNDISVNADSKTVYTIHFDNTTVGIGSISANEAKNHKVFTLGGVRVNGKPAAGMYIVDGKKTIVK